MAETIAVKPARKGMGLVHPVSGLLRDEGGEWIADQFTFRRLEDKDIKLKPDAEPSEKDEAEAKADAPAAPPADPVTGAIPATTEDAPPARTTRR